MAIGAKLKLLLKQRKMTVTELADKTGISINTLYGIIKRDNKTINPDTAAKIVDCLGVSIAELLSFDEFVESAKIEFDDIENRKKLLLSYDALNNAGRIEAEKRVSELVQISKYQR